MSYREFVAAEIQKNSNVLAQRWLESLKAIVLEDTGDIFPTDEYLDHIPVMICEIGQIIKNHDTELALFNSLISRKALELGELRHQQNATVNQLLREYDLLAQHLEAFVADISKEYSTPLESADMMHTSNTIHAIVRRILQDTVDSFVSRYVETIDQQKERLKYFNNFISHEVRSPLQTALLNVEMILDDEENTLPASSNELTDVKAAILQVVSIMNNVDSLMDSSEVDVVDTPATQKIGIADLVTDICEQLELSMTDSGVRLQLHEDLGMISTDTGKLRLILSNLLSNAIKYSNPKIDSSYVRVSRTNTATGAVAITVEDNGIGISSDMLLKVKQLKVRAHDHEGGQTSVDGHGIGLYLVDEAVKFLGGEMSIESTEIGGTKVTVIIPEQS